MSRYSHSASLYVIVLVGSFSHYFDKVGVDSLIRYTFWVWKTPDPSEESCRSRSGTASSLRIEPNVELSTDAYLRRSDL